jgi:hypothetical protein
LRAAALAFAKRRYRCCDNGRADGAFRGKLWCES